MYLIWTQQWRSIKYLEEILHLSISLNHKKKKKKQYSDCSSFPQVCYRAWRHAKSTALTAIPPSKLMSLRQSVAVQQSALTVVTSDTQPSHGAHICWCQSRLTLGGGESWGEVRRLCGREYSWSIQRCSINLINGLITASKQSSEIRSRKEEEGWGRRTKAAHGQSGTVALLCLENTNRTRSSFFWGLNDHVH